LLTGALFFLQRERRMQASAQQAQLDRIKFDGQMAEARLQMLEAQIEPHFLFNSLATVKSLYQRDPQKGRLLIRDLSEYLHGALPLMRGADSTLRKEFSLCEAYLRVLQVRMGDRLKVEIDLPRDLEHHGMPPMMLPTLIENAVKHGISPMREGGTVRIVARLNGEELQVSVADNGAGFRQTSGVGIGLANTRARLATMFGDEASLTVVANAGAGVSATLRVPAVLHHAHGVA
jgi:LytS/YehU family sensor histidine kinase